MAKEKLRTQINFVINIYIVNMYYIQFILGQCE
jgi:hypothetical protein